MTSFTIYVFFANVGYSPLKTAFIINLIAWVDKIRSGNKKR
jgi:hypothetical protein